MHAPYSACAPRRYGACRSPRSPSPPLPATSTRVHHCRYYTPPACPIHHPTTFPGAWTHCGCHHRTTTTVCNATTASATPRRYTYLPGYTCTFCHHHIPAAYLYVPTHLPAAVHYTPAGYNHTPPGCWVTATTTVCNCTTTSLLFAGTAACITCTHTHTHVPTRALPAYRTWTTLYHHTPPACLRTLPPATLTRPANTSRIATHGAGNRRHQRCLRASSLIEPLPDTAT